MEQRRNQVEPLNIRRPKKQSSFFKITFKECLALFIGTAIPVVIGIYASVTNEQIHKSARLAADEQQRIAVERRVFDLERAAELYQQKIYKDFLDAMYTWDKDGKLNDSVELWAFANARYRAAHREFDAIRKAQALLFLKERQLIGRQNCITGCEEKNTTDLINLKGLNFDNLNLSSETGNLSRLDFSCVTFDQISLINTIFSNANLNGVVFRSSRLNGAKFQDSSLNCSKFINTELHGTNFYKSNLNGALFSNVDLSLTILTQEQQKEARFENVILPNGTEITAETMMTSIQAENTTAMTPAETTSATSIRVIIPDIPANATWEQNGTTVAGGNRRGNASNQLHDPYGLFINDENESILIADSGNHRIMEWKMGDTNGQVVAGGNGGGNRLDQLNRPTAVLIDKETDSLIICNYINGRIVRWFRRIGTTEGESLIETFSCWGLTIDDQRYLYVSDVNKHEVRRYHLGGDMQDETIVASWKGPNQMVFPPSYYIFVDRQQTIYVSETMDNRIMKWNKGSKKGIVIADDERKDNNLTQLSKPRGLFFDISGTLYIVDASKCVTRWPHGASQGTVIVDETAQLSFPMALSYDQNGNIYIADSDQNLIQRFSIQ